MRSWRMRDALTDVKYGETGDVDPYSEEYDSAQFEMDFCEAGKRKTDAR